MDTYQLIASGRGRKWERFGAYTLQRPAAQAVWPESGDLPARPDGVFTREDGNSWEVKKLPPSWHCTVDGITFKLSATDFGHIGLFPEQRPLWRTIEESIRDAKRPIEALNLFAYSGGSTLAAAKGGAKCCHVDAAKGMVDWARDNARLNGLEKAPIRWIVDDAMKFIKREVKRGRKYDAIILDPPSFGRGAKGEVFKIEEEIIGLLECCRDLLSDRPLFLLLSCHTPGWTPTTLTHLLEALLPKGQITAGEMFLAGDGTRPVPSGSFARWTP